jgi:two-component system CheB/CheR fusion protein
MDGYDFLARLRSDFPQYSNVPAIALTGYGRDEDIERARMVGFTTHLTKPLDFSQLLRLARVTLHR